MTKITEFGHKDLTQLRGQVRAYGDHLLEGGHTAMWADVIELEGTDRVDQVLSHLVRAYVAGPALRSEDLTLPDSPEYEAFLQLSHGCLHELLVHVRDKRHFALESWRRIELLLLQVVNKFIDGKGTAPVTPSLATPPVTPAKDADAESNAARHLAAQEPLRDFLLIASDAGFQFSRDIRATVREWMAQNFDDETVSQPQDAAPQVWKWQDPFLSMINQVSEGGKVIDEFDCFDNIENQMTFLPEDTLADVLSHGLSFDRAEIKEIIPLMVLHPCEDVALIALDVLEDAPASVSTLGLSRLIIVRNWLPASRHARLDQVVRAVRVQHPAAYDDEDKRFADVVAVRHYASTVDGAGAQNIISLLRSKFGFKAFVGVVKEHIGWIDIWSSAWTTRVECERLIRSFQKSVYTIEVNQDYIEYIFRQGLLWNTESAIVPRPEFLHWIEMLHDTHVNPREFNADDYLYLLDLEPDTKPTPFQIRQAIDASAQWLRQGKFAVGWFEIGDHVEHYLAHELPDDTESVLEHCVHTIFDPLRKKWSQRLMRMALWAGSNTKRRGPKMMDFFVIAYLIDSDLPLEHLPFIRDLAMATLSAYAHERA